MNIVQEEVNYDEFAYQAYVGQLNQQPVDDFPNYEPFPGTEQLQVYQQEDIGQFIPTKPTSTSVSKPVQKPPVKKRNHEYSVLNDKKKLPIDLGNDEILLSLSAAHKQGDDSELLVEEFVCEGISKDVMWIQDATDSVELANVVAQAQLIPLTL